jgi:hypothetical protein
VSLLYGHEGDSDWYFPRIAWRKRFGRIYMCVCVCLCLYVLYYTWLLHISILYTYRRAAFVSVFVWFSPEFGQFAPLGIRALSFAVWFGTWRNFLLLLLAASRQRHLIGLVVFLFWELLGEIILKLYVIRQMIDSLIFVGGFRLMTPAPATAPRELQETSQTLFLCVCVCVCCALSVVNSRRPSRRVES